MIDFIWDKDRKERTGIAEVVFCQGKTIQQINAILDYHSAQKNPVLLTRLSPETHEQLQLQHKAQMIYFAEGHIATFNQQLLMHKTLQQGIAIVTAGTSDIKIAIEASKTLEFNGFTAPIIADVGVAGVQRLLSRLDELNQYKVLIAIAGMEGALFSVLAGLVKAPVIAVPSSVGYGVAEGGRAALHSALSSCAPGVVVVNIDNGFGAAVAAVKIISSTTITNR